MDDRGQSDGPVVPEKLPNNAQGGAAEAVEGSGPAKGSTASETRPGPSAGQGALSGLDRVRRVAGKAACSGSECAASPTGGCPSPASFTPGQTRALTPEPKGGAQCVCDHEQRERG